MRFLPPDRPDFNPIEMLFSKVKALVRAGDWRDVPALLQGIRGALDAVTLPDVFGRFPTPSQKFSSVKCSRRPGPHSVLSALETLRPYVPLT
jgi:hypothetical protein